MRELDKERLKEIGVDLEPEKNDEVVVSYAKLMYYISVFLVVVVLPPIIYFSYVNFSRAARIHDEWDNFIITATRNYLAKNTAIRESVESGGIDRIYFSALMDQGFLPEHIINPSTGKSVEFCNYVLVSRSLEYTVSGSHECVASDEQPIIRLNGRDTMRIPVGGVYRELGAVVTDTNGNDISDRLEIIGTVNELEAGVYRLIYSAVNRDGIAADNVYRTVLVGIELVSLNQDLIPPMVSIGEPVYANNQVEIPIIALDNINLRSLHYRSDDRFDFEEIRISGTHYQIMFVDVDSVCNTLEAYAVDAAGNRSETVSLEYGNCEEIIPINDTTPPNIAIHGAERGWVTGPVTLTITARDDVRLNQIFYKYRAHFAYASRSFLANNTRNGSVQVTLTEPGIYTVSAYATDVAGNFSQIRSVTVKIRGTGL